MISRIVGWSCILNVLCHFIILMVNCVMEGHNAGWVIFLILYETIVVLLPLHLVIGLIMVAARKWTRLSLAASYLITPVLIVAGLVTAALLRADMGLWKICAFCLSNAEAVMSVVTLVGIITPWIAVYRWTARRKPPIY